MSNKHLGTGAMCIIMGGVMIPMCMHMMVHDQGTNWGIWDLIGIGLGFLEILTGVVFIALAEEDGK